VKVKKRPPAGIKHPANSPLDGPSGSQVSNRRSPPGLRLVFLMVVAVGLVSASFVLNVPGRIGYLFATRALQRHDMAAAQLWIDRVQWVAPGDPQTYLVAARLARRQGRMEEVAEQLKLATQRGADRSAVRLEELLALAQTGQLDGIEHELITRLSDPGVDAAEISDAYANGLATVSRFGDSAAVLAAWSKDFPDDPRPDYRAGRLHEHFHRWDQAEASYRQALSRDSNYYPARYRLGRVLFTGRRVKEAMAEFSACLSMPNPLAAKVQLAACYRAQGNADQSRTLLRSVLSHDRETIAASYHAVEEYPEHFEAATQLGDLESEAGNYEQALYWLRLAVAENPRDLVARYALAVTLRQLGHAEQSEAEFKRVLTARRALERANPLRNRIAERPDDLEARLEIGELLLEHESQSMGLFWIRSILTFDADHLAAHQVLARYYRARALESNQYASVAAHHEQAVVRLQKSVP
jgi:tetratricopeptide (TPR) repeat protein